LSSEADRCYISFVGFELYVWAAFIFLMCSNTYSHMLSTDDSHHVDGVKRHAQAILDQVFVCTLSMSRFSYLCMRPGFS
jgi:hypothetical protein